MSLVTTRKRKGIEKPLLASHEKGKVRIIERSVDGHGDDKLARTRMTTPASRTFNNIRRESFKIFSIFRGGKGMVYSYYILDALTLLYSYKHDIHTYLTSFRLPRISKCLY